MASGLKVGLFGGVPGDKELSCVIKEKVEFGVMKLRKLGSNAESDYFEKKNLAKEISQK